MHRDAPFTWDHAGFVARFPTDPSTFGLKLAVWIAIAAVGGGIFGTFAGSATPVLLFGVALALVAVLVGLSIAWTLLTPKRLCLRAGRLVLGGSLGEREIPLEGLEVAVEQWFTAQDERVARLRLTAGGLRFELDGHAWRTPDLEELATLLRECAAAVEPEEEVVPPEMLRALRARVPE